MPRGHGTDLHQEHRPLRRPCRSTSRTGSRSRISSGRSRATRWERRQLRVERNTDRMLALLDRHGARCTFFVLGWVAERCPRWSERIAAAGHEIACHGYGHELVYELSEDEFRDDVRRCKAMLEDLTGSPGTRLPGAQLLDHRVVDTASSRSSGFAYDSSAFPTSRTTATAACRRRDGRPRWWSCGPGFHEVSISCLMVGSRGLPWGRRRLLPAAALRRLPPRGGPDTPLGRALRLLHPPLGDRPGPAARDAACPGCTVSALRRPRPAPRIASDHCWRTSAGGASRTYSPFHGSSRPTSAISGHGLDPAPPPGRPEEARRTRACRSVNGCRKPSSALCRNWRARPWRPACP